MYVLARTSERTGKTEYLCRDNSNRIFWRSFADKLWMSTFQNKAVAEVALTTIKANYLDQGYSYGVENIAYSVSELKQSRVRKLEGIPDKDYTII